jgi:hypothetical protein
MKLAAFNDLDCNKAQKPALSKLQLLPKFILAIQKVAFFPSYLEAGILEGMKLWLLYI